MPVKQNRLKQSTLVDELTLVKILTIGRALMTVRTRPLLLRKITESAGSLLAADMAVLYECQDKARDMRLPPTVWRKRATAATASFPPPSYP
jgi:hypothetical protein